MSRSRPGYPSRSDLDRVLWTRYLHLDSLRQLERYVTFKWTGDSLLHTDGRNTFRICKVPGGGGGEEGARAKPSDCLASQGEVQDESKVHVTNQPDLPLISPTFDLWSTFQTESPRMGQSQAETQGENASESGKAKTLTTELRPKIKVEVVEPGAPEAEAMHQMLMTRHKLSQRQQIDKLNTVGTHVLDLSPSGVLRVNMATSCSSTNPGNTFKVSHGRDYHWEYLEREREKAFKYNPVDNHGRFEHQTANEYGHEQEHFKHKLFDYENSAKRRRLNLSSESVSDPVHHHHHHPQQHRSHGQQTRPKQGPLHRLAPKQCYTLQMDICSPCTRRPDVNQFLYGQREPHQGVHYLPAATIRVSPTEYVLRVEFFQHQFNNKEQITCRFCSERVARTKAMQLTQFVRVFSRNSPEGVLDLVLTRSNMLPIFGMNRVQTALMANELVVRVVAGELTSQSPRTFE